MAWAIQCQLANRRRIVLEMFLFQEIWTRNINSLVKLKAPEGEAYLMRCRGTVHDLAGLLTPPFVQTWPEGS